MTGRAALRPVCPGVSSVVWQVTTASRRLAGVEPAPAETHECAAPKRLLPYRRCVAYDPWNAYALHEEEQTAGAPDPSAGDRSDTSSTGATVQQEPAAPEAAQPEAAPESTPDAWEPDDDLDDVSHSDDAAANSSLSLSDDDDPQLVRARAPDAAALLTAVGRVMDVLDTERRQLEILRVERREAEQEREAARVQAARLEAELAAERTRRETAELELMKAKRDLYGDEARLRAARLEALVEAESTRRQELQRELQAARADLEAASRRRWWRHK